MISSNIEILIVKNMIDEYKVQKKINLTEKELRTKFLVMVEPHTNPNCKLVIVD